MKTEKKGLKIFLVPRSNKKLVVRPGQLFSHVILIALLVVMVYPLFMASLTSPSHFKVDEKRCIGCGRCERRCPLSNVKLSAEHVPTWGKNCTMCLACYHVCPSHAINYGPFTSGKGQYLAPDKLQG